MLHMHLLSDPYLVSKRAQLHRTCRGGLEGGTAARAPTTLGVGRWSNELFRRETGRRRQDEKAQR